MTYLSDHQIKFYNEKGYVAPIDVLSIQEANEIREEIEFISVLCSLLIFGGVYLVSINTNKIN